MKQLTVDEAAKEILAYQQITFLTGAGVSTPSGVPDYRSLSGIYHGMEQPEYLLSHQAMVNEPDKFYQFVKKIYHPEAKPNIIHLEIAHLAKEKNVWVVSQNIDGLHAKAKSPQLVNFHGSLYQCHCRKCQQTVDWKEYLHSDKHQACGGQIRPDIVLYGEGFQDGVMDQATKVGKSGSITIYKRHEGKEAKCNREGTNNEEVQRIRVSALKLDPEYWKNVPLSLSLPLSPHTHACTYN